MKDSIFRVVIAGGGSGGHVYPVIAVIEALQKKCEELKAPLSITRIGPRDGYGVLFQNQGVKVSSIVTGKLRRYFSLANIIDVPKFFIGFFQALLKLYFVMPDIVFSKGGTGALPVVLAAWFYRIPVAVHESDAKPGLTNLFSARFAKKIFVSFPVAAAYFDPARTVVTGQPLRKELFGTRTTKELAKDALGFSSSHPLTLILGGSQGSKRINNFILENLEGISEYSQVLHQTGVANFADVQKLSRAALIDGSYKNRYQSVAYFEKLSMPLTAADVVVTRPGSGLFEIAAFGIPMILIPITESANGHQQVNAYELQKTGAAVIIEESNLLPGIFMAELKKILDNADLRSKMSEAAHSFFIPGAGEMIVDELLQLGAAN